MALCVITFGLSAAAEPAKKGPGGSGTAPQRPPEAAAEASGDQRRGPRAPAGAEPAAAGRAGDGAARAEGAASKVAVEGETTGVDGEKSYQFQAIEVEGRLKAPQILYFLRRVRAELRVGRLGHRSFLPELRDTRRSDALR